MSILTQTELNLMGNTKENNTQVNKNPQGKELPKEEPKEETKKVTTFKQSSQDEIGKHVRNIQKLKMNKCEVALLIKSHRIVKPFLENEKEIDKVIKAIEKKIKSRKKDIEIIHYDYDYVLDALKSDKRNIIEMFETFKPKDYDKEHIENVVDFMVKIRLLTENKINFTQDYEELYLHEKDLIDNYNNKRNQVKKDVVDIIKKLKLEEQKKDKSKNYKLQRLVSSYMEKDYKVKDLEKDVKTLLEG